MSTTRMLAGVLGAAALVAPAAAAAAVPDGLADRYAREYRQAEHAGGDPGRHIVRHGVREDGRRRDARRGEVRASIRVLERMQPSASAPAAAAGSGGSAVSGSLAAIAACESGGDPTAVSPDGQYRGKYQFDQQTWEAVGGTGDPAAAPEAVQDELAARLQAQAGSNPWPVCG